MMRLFSKIAFLCLLITLATGKGLKSVTRIEASINNEENALEVLVRHGTDVVRARGLLGMSLPAAVGALQTCSSPDPNTSCFNWGDYAQVLIKPGSNSLCSRIEWTSSFARDLEDCYDLQPGVNWYGGAVQYSQRWPINDEPREEVAYTVGNWKGVLEYHWILSNGAAIVIDYDTPLFHSLNSTHPDKVCFRAKDQEPFAKRSPLQLNYEWCTGDDVRATYKHVMSTFYEKPEGHPDEEMLIRPFWSTWAQYHADINQTTVLEYAHRVVDEGFTLSSHIEIDDNWESCYGEETFDPEKFPDPKGMIEEIKSMNLKTTIWVHPFINYECTLFQEGMERGYFVKNAKGKLGMTDWWQGSYSGLIDSTNEEAVRWWNDRLNKLKENTGIDSFKFDAGETEYLPASPAFPSEDPSTWPNIYSTRYVEAVAGQGGMVETRMQHRTQRLPIFVRMGDKDSRWGYDNGLRSLIPWTLQFSVMGYPFTLPDMIGGNAYGDRPSKELYIRWMQVNIFMPAVQFSLVPWNYDQETIQLCKDVLEQRELYREDIMNAARQAVVDHSPMNRPLWWADPQDPETFTVDDEYMLGDYILVAPVVMEGEVSRDIYLPGGYWRAGMNESEIYEGPRWLRDYPAPLLSVTPFFVKFRFE